jgi:hypothetical protein
MIPDVASLFRVVGASMVALILVESAFALGFWIFHKVTRVEGGDE